jgi:hypothetical protein
LAAELESRPAFYALRPGGRRDLITLLHPPYTLWHLSYVVIGAAAAPQIFASRLAAALAAFFLAVGVGAHCLDELHGRPLQTSIKRPTLVALAVLGLGGAMAIGIAGVFVVSITLAPLVIVGAFLVVSYNLELFDGAFHTDFWFAAAWGAFPALTGWWSNALAVHSGRQVLAAGAAVLTCFWLSLAQRRLSTPVRELRRKTETVSGEQRLVDGTIRQLDRARLAAPLDGALRALSVAVPLSALAAVALRI